MKLLLILSSLFFLQSLSAQEASKKKDLPDFTKVLPTEKFFNKQKLAVGFTYGYATNLELNKLKPALLKSLGDGWKFDDPSKKDLSQLKKQMKSQGMTLLAASELKHPDFAHFEIGVTLVEGGKKLEKKYILSIITVDLEKAAAFQKEK